MSEVFKKEVIKGYEAGEILGLCCMDACGMVSNPLTSLLIRSKTHLQGLDLCSIRVVVQYRMPKKLDALVQRFGCAGCDPLIQATAILLVEKTYFNKPELKCWASRFEDTPSTIPAKQVSPNGTIISP